MGMLDEHEPLREQALMMLAEGATSVETARALRVDPSTLRRWRSNSGFASRLATLRAPHLEAARVDLQALVGRAVQVLAEVMDDKDAPEVARLRAAEIVLERAGLDKPADVQTDPDLVARYMQDTYPEAVERARRSAQIPVDVEVVDVVVNALDTGDGTG